MLNNWNKISDDLQACKVQKDDKTYTFALKLQDIGVYSGGQALVLWGKLLGDKSEVLAAFWTKNDGYSTYEKKSNNGKLWSKREAENEALKIIANVVENIY